MWEKSSSHLGLVWKYMYISYLSHGSFVCIGLYKGWIPQQDQRCDTGCFISLLRSEAPTCGKPICSTFQWSISGWLKRHDHYSDVIIGAMASQITSLTIVYSTIYSGADQRKHQSSASLAFVRGIHRWPVNSPHKGPVTCKMFPFDDVIIPYVFDLGQVRKHMTYLYYL